MILTTEQIDEYSVKYEEYAVAHNLTDFPHLFDRGKFRWFKALHHVQKDFGKISKDPGPCPECSKPLHPSPLHPAGWICFEHTVLHLKLTEKSNFQASCNQCGQPYETAMDQREFHSDGLCPECQEKRRSDDVP